MYKELVQYIVECLVEQKDKVVITESTDENKTNILIQVAEEEMGRVIGKDGRIIRGIREIVRAYASREKATVYVDVNDTKKGE